MLYQTDIFPILKQWFAWANTLFGELLLKMYGLGRVEASFTLLSLVRQFVISEVVEVIDEVVDFSLFDVCVGLLWFMEPVPANPTLMNEE